MRRTVKCILGVTLALSLIFSAGCEKKATVNNQTVVHIPYDNDRCFGVTLWYNPSGDAMTGVKSVSQRAVGNGGSSQKNPLINYSVARTGFYLDEFAGKLEKVASSKWMTVDYFKSIYNIAKNNYANDASPDKEMDNAKGYIFKFDADCSNGLYSDNGNASFKDYVEAKLKFYNENK